MQKSPYELIAGPLFDLSARRAAAMKSPQSIAKRAREDFYSPAIFTISNFFFKNIFELIFEFNKCIRVTIIKFIPKIITLP